MKKICPECHGTGQSRYFKGESRFLLSHEECPACCGLGFIDCDQQAGGRQLEEGNDGEESEGKNPS
jgi:DnaJ-class molecular chaperone